MRIGNWERLGWELGENWGGIGLAWELGVDWVGIGLELVRIE